MNDQLSDSARAAVYQSHRDRTAHTFKKKHRLQYDREFAALTSASPEMSVLEIGCGTGLFLRYLEDAGYKEIVGVDMDDELAHVLGDLKSSEIYFDDVASLLSGPLNNRTFDRIVMLDVAEHIQLPALVELLTTLREHLNDDGRLLLRVPNIESPWGLRMFYGSFDHVTPLSPGRVHEVGLLSGWICEGCYPQEPVTARKRFKEHLLHKLLETFLTNHPEIWTANLLAVYRKELNS